MINENLFWIVHLIVNLWQRKDFRFLLTCKGKYRLNKREICVIIFFFKLPIIVNVIIIVVLNLWLLSKSTYPLCVSYRMCKVPSAPAAHYLGLTPWIYNTIIQWIQI